MAASLSGVGLSAIRISASGTADAWRPSSALPQRRLFFATRGRAVQRAVTTAASSAPFGGLSAKVAESIKKAEEACGGNAASKECVAAWNEVEELSAAAASHARDRAKENSDSLESYCKDNPDSEECRTHGS